MLLLLKRVETFKAAHDQIKIKALDRALDKKRLQSLFPEYFPVDPFEDAYDEQGVLDPEKVDEDAIEFSIPGSREEDETISAWIREREAGTISTASLGEWV